jgi:hypothetical protein
MKTLINFVKNLKTFYQFYKDYEYDGNDCRFIIENYQEVLSNRTIHIMQKVLLLKWIGGMRILGNPCTNAHR